MVARRIPSRAKTAPIETLHSLLTVQDADAAFRSRSVTDFLLKYDELPAWRQDNHFILTHYRPTSDSFFISFQSLVQLHNESVNIHSHLFGAWIFFFTAPSLYMFEQQSVTWADTIAFLFFFSSAVICLGISATYHTISNHSPKVPPLPTDNLLHPVETLRSINAETKSITWASLSSFLEALCRAFIMASIASRCCKGSTGVWYV